MSEQRYWGTQFHTLDSECTWGTDGCPSLSNLYICFLCNFCTNLGFNLEPQPKPFPLEPPSTNSNQRQQQLFLSHRACVIRCICRFQGLYSNQLVVISPWLDSIQSSFVRFPWKNGRETCEPGTQGWVVWRPLIVGFYKMHFWSFCHIQVVFDVRNIHM